MARYPLRCSIIVLAVSLLIAFSLQSANALVPASKTFKVVNGGGFSRYVAEYNSNYRVLPLSAAAFRLCFYNTTPNAFTLAIGLGSFSYDLGIKWVWDANRGRPVKENAVLSFGQDGNLVLSDSDGSIAWQSSTANKGVADISLQPNGNLVLVDGKGKPVWQSFVQPRDTLVPGQNLNYKGPKTLISRVSEKDGSEGAYSFQLEQAHWSLFYTVKGKPLRYYKSEEFDDKGFIANFNFRVDESNEVFFDYDMIGSPASGTRIFVRTKYSSPYSIFRMGWDGNVRIYTFKDIKGDPWRTEYIQFDRYIGSDECNLPRRCGSLGVCLENQCVACPRPEGLLGWSKSCAPPPTAPCSGGRASSKYYEIVGVDHFLSAYNDGLRPVTPENCRSRCSKDCGCFGYFYNKNSSACYLAPLLGTLLAVDDTNHVGYIKTA